MKIIVGLGNPGHQYQGTRHNIGYDVLRKLSERWGFSQPSASHNADVAEGMMYNEKILLCAPTTFMNLSGKSVASITKFYKIELSSVIIVCDDLNLDLGSIRLRAKGTAGGQKGLAHILETLQTTEIPRLRLGIGRPRGRIPVVDYVLSKFFSEEQQDADDMVEHASDALETWVKVGITEAMTKHNRSADN